MVARRMAPLVGTDRSYSGRIGEFNGVQRIKRLYVLAVMTGVLLIHGLVSLTGHVRAVPDRVSGDFDAANRVSGTPDVRWLDQAPYQYASESAVQAVSGGILRVPGFRKCIALGEHLHTDTYRTLQR